VHDGLPERKMGSAMGQDREHARLRVGDVVAKVGVGQADPNVTHIDERAGRLQAGGGLSPLIRYYASWA